MPQIHPFEHAAVAGAGMIRAEGFDVFAPQLPYKPAGPVLVRINEQVECAPLHRRRVGAPSVEKPPRVIDRLPPFASETA